MRLTEDTFFLQAESEKFVDASDAMEPDGTSFFGGAGTSDLSEQSVAVYQILTSRVPTLTSRATDYDNMAIKAFRFTALSSATSTSATAYQQCFCGLRLRRKVKDCLCECGVLVLVCIPALL